MAKNLLTLGIVIGLAVWAGIASGTRAAQTTGGAITVDSDDLAGTVTGPSGPEAGVWVIAETTDLPTRFSRAEFDLRCHECGRVYRFREAPA